MENQIQENGYIKRTITFLAPSNLGDRYLNRLEMDFHETKNGIMVVEEKVKEN